MPFDNDITTPSSDADLRNATNNRVKIIDYDSLSDYEDIDQLLTRTPDAFILLYEHAENSGHWTVVGKDINEEYFFFCSYGSDVDEPLSWVSQDTREKLGSGQKYLSKLFNGRDVLYNKTAFQDENTDQAVCGDMAAFIVNQIMKKKPFETALNNLEKLKLPNLTYADSIVRYWNS
jgi:hypothetical protein